MVTEIEMKNQKPKYQDVENNFNRNSAIEQLQFMFASWDKSKDLIEFRGFKRDGSKNSDLYGGFFDSIDQLVGEIANVDGKINCYISLNSRSINSCKDIITSINKITRVTKSGTDQMVDYCPNLLIDIDPIVEKKFDSEGKGIHRPANDSEIENAKEVFDKCLSYIQLKMNIDDIYRQFSGNGFHAIIALKPLHRTLCPGRCSPVGYFLRWLNARFGNPKAKVDQGNYNLSRITKLCGSLSVKGIEEINRPHRRATQIYCPSARNEINLLDLFGEEIYEQVGIENQEGSNGNNK